MTEGTIFNIKLNNEKVLLAGPWVGELGWELFCWQGYIRTLSKEYKKTIVVSKAGHEFLYKDFCDEFHVIDLPLDSKFDSWSCYGLDDNTILSKIIGIEYDVRFPSDNIGFSMNHDGTAYVFNNNYSNQTFIKYESDILQEKFDVIIHPRNRTVGGERNWSEDSWQKLVDLLLKDYSVAMIGNHETFNIKNAIDFRNIPMESTVSLISRSRLVVGPSSGPMHLASLCGTPHLVWSTQFNFLRYTKHWNPFNTPVYFYSKDDWNPSVDFIYEKIRENIK